jgi:putative aminopeptidase FrvX
MAIKELLIELAQASGVSGHELPVRRLVRRELEKYADEVLVTKLGSVVALKRAAARRSTASKGRGAPERPKLLLEGHMDEIGLIVTAIDQGFIRFTQIGGYDVRVLPAQNVIVHGRQELPGLIGSRPPHVLHEDERAKSTPMSDLFIDVGLAEARVRELVTVGDVITIDRKVTELRNNCLAGKAFDDRAAVAVVIDALRQLKGLDLQWDIYAVANVQEEAGAWFAGAFTSAFQIHPDVAVALDVSHADQPGIGDVNLVPLDKGPGIALGPNIHASVHAKLVEVARAQEIPHRITAYAGPTGTDAWAIQVVAEGIPTGLIDLPLRYMHTSVEMLALRDLERASRLLAAFATSLDDEFYIAVKGQPPVPGRQAPAPKRLKKR